MTKARKMAHKMATLPVLREDTGTPIWAAVERRTDKVLYTSLTRETLRGLFGGQRGIKIKKLIAY
jgi:hypothetical protein